MIYTVTLNPAVDCVFQLDRLDEGRVNRASQRIFAGGKGINVSLVLKELGVSSTAMGFTAGFTGEFIESEVERAGIKSDFVRIERGITRINAKIKTDTETEINANGACADEKALEKFFAKLDKISRGDILILSGSIPNGFPRDIYRKILQKLRVKDIKAVVDASDEALTSCLEYKPFLVKPNNFELGEIFGAEVKTADDAAKYAFRLREAGARNVLVSMAGDGAVLADETGEIHFCAAHSGKVKNSVGAGDSMVAGFIAGLSDGFDYALRLGAAAGGATAFSDGLASRGEIMRLLSEDPEQNPEK